MPVVKESSDALTPPVVTNAFIERAPRSRSAADYVALTLASCGVGYIPIAPGTWGAGVGLALFLGYEACSRSLFPLPTLINNSSLAQGEMLHFLNGAARAQFWHTSLFLILLVLIVLIGIWAATRAEPLLGRKDPGVVVIDEVAGQLITFLFVPAGAPWWIIGAGFVMFRVFDIWKPYPIRRLEALESGLGIMADDVLAGIYAAIALSLVTSIYLLR